MRDVECLLRIFCQAHAVQKDTQSPFSRRSDLLTYEKKKFKHLEMAKAAHLNINWIKIVDKSCN